MSRLLIALTALLLTLSVRATTTDSLQFTSLQQEDRSTLPHWWPV